MSVLWVAFCRYSALGKVGSDVLDIWILIMLLTFDVAIVSALVKG